MGGSSSRITEFDVRSFFESKTKDCPTASPKSKIEDDEVSMVIVLHRHGARFPTKEMSSDLSWPSDDAFWDLYGPPGSARCKVRVRCSLTRDTRTRNFFEVSRRTYRKACQGSTSSTERCSQLGICSEECFPV